MQKKLQYHIKITKIIPKQQMQVMRAPSLFPCHGPTCDTVDNYITEKPYAPSF